MHLITIPVFAVKFILGLNTNFDELTIITMNNTSFHESFEVVRATCPT